MLGGRKNIEASNNSFQVKLNVYKGKGKYNDSKKGVTGFEITKKIYEDAREGHIKQWDEQAMKGRWNWFLSELEEVLRIDTSSIYINEKNKIENIKDQIISVSAYKKEQTKEELFEKESWKQERKQKNKEFFNQFLSKIKKEYPDFYLKHLTNNAIRAVPSKKNSHITVFRAISNTIGVFWFARTEEDRKLFDLIKTDPVFPKPHFKIYDTGQLFYKSPEMDWNEKASNSNEISVYKEYDDIYDFSSYPDQMRFLNENLALLYKYMIQKISEFKEDKPQKVS